MYVHPSPPLNNEWDVTSFMYEQDMYSRTRYEAFGEEVRRRILLGTFTLSRRWNDFSIYSSLLNIHIPSLYESYYKKAQQIRKLVHDDFQKAFQAVVNIYIYTPLLSIRYPFSDFSPFFR